MVIEKVTADLTKDQIKSFAKIQAKELIESGIENPLEMFIKIKKMEDFLEEYKENLKEAVKKEISKYGKEANVFNTKATLRGTGTKYDYSKDSVYADLEDKIKQRKMILDTALKYTEVIFDSNGEEVSKVPVKNHGGDAIVISY